VLGRAAALVLLAAGPALFAALAASILVGLLQVRPLWTWEPLRPKLSRLDPLGGLKNLIGLRRLAELVRTLLFLVAMVTVMVFTLKEALPDLLSLTGASPAVVGVTLARYLALLGLRGGLILLVAAAADYGLQRLWHLKDLRMTKEEVRREHKETEGDPQHKAARKRLHQEILEHDMVERVKGASLVVVNPTRIAVALRYDAAQDGAPRVVARGERLLAARIREVARQAKVPIFHDVPLARALHQLAPGDEIPEALYVAVADLLRAVGEESRNADRAQPA
jgi:flagellar biosynthesis protein FlhB